jgi:hypothetical protein
MRTNRLQLRLGAILLSVAVAGPLCAQTAPPPAPQNPSPMVEYTRVHARVSKTELPGQRYRLSLGTLFIPQGTKLRGRVPLVVHFHGAGWLAEYSAEKARQRTAVLSVQLGAGSGVYAQAFRDPARFRDLLNEAAKAASPAQPVQFGPVVLSGFSAGYGAIREIIRNRDNWLLVDGIVLEDGIHTGYVPDGKPGPLDPAPLEPFLVFAREAVAGRKAMIITHSEIFPGTFASTTECTDHLLGALGLKRRPVLKWGPGGMQQTSDVRSGRFHLLGFAGNSAPDHVDHFHGMARWLKLLK